MGECARCGEREEEMLGLEARLAEAERERGEREAARQREAAGREEAREAKERLEGRLEQVQAALNASELNAARMLVPGPRSSSCPVREERLWVCA